MPDRPLVLVTGGAGAIGSQVVRRLLDRGHAVTVLDDLDSGFADLVPADGGVTFIQGSITDERAVEEAFATQPEVILHLAAHFANQNSVDHPIVDLEVNAAGTLRLLEASHLRGIGRFVYASSSCVYGNAPVMAEDSPIHLDTPYAVSKFAGEQYTAFYHRQHGLRTAVVRIFNSFGPGERPGRYRNVIPNFTAAALRGEPLRITGTGDETRDFNWVDNTVSGLLLAAEHDGAIGGTFNIGSGLATRIVDLANAINELTDNGAGIEYVPRRDWDSVQHRRADITRARTVLGYEPEIALYAQLARTIDWMRTQI